MEAAFFDLDKTVIDRASIAAFGRPFFEGLINRRRSPAPHLPAHLPLLRRGRGGLARIRESMLAVTKGWDRAQVRQIVRETAQTIEPIMYAEALELMERHRAAGHRVYLVSASPEEIVRPLADLLGVDDAIARGARWTTKAVHGPMEFDASDSRRRSPCASWPNEPGSTRRQQRVLGLRNRPAHARGGRPSRCHQPRPRPGQGGGASVGGRSATSPSRSGCATGSDARLRS